MRAGERYDCESCGRTGVARDGLCEPLCLEARDENGNAPPAPARQTFEWNRGADQLLSHLIRPVFRLAVAVKRLRRRGQVAALRRAAGPVRPIAAAQPGLVAISGEVEVLTPVTAPDDAPVAAYAWRTAHRRKKPVTNSKILVEVDQVTLSQGAGRFLIRDASGVALVDDDWVRLFDGAGQVPDPTRRGELTVRAGDHVTVIGHARREVLPAAGASASYRGPPEGLCFEGGTGRPVCVFVSGGS